MESLAPATPALRLRRVLFAADLDPSAKFGSAEEQIWIAAGAFKERGGLFLPLFAAPRREAVLANYREAGLPVVFLDLRKFHLLTLLRLAWLIVRYRIGVVHWNFFPALLNGYVWGLSLLTPWVAHFYSDRISRLTPSAPPRSRVKRWLKRLFLRRYSRVLGVSQFVVHCLEAETTWPPAVVRPHRINTERFAPCSHTRDEIRSRMNAQDDFILLEVGQLIDAKGVDVLLKALPLLPDRVKVWLIGAGEQETAFRALAEELGVADRVRWLGLQNHVEQYMQAADAFVCPSRWAEAAGLVVLEAQACGLPVLASAIGGIPEYLLDSTTGFLFPSGNFEALADRIHRLVNDPQEAEALSRQARAWAIEQFSIHAALEDYLSLYLTPA